MFGEECTLVKGAEQKSTPLEKRIGLKLHQ